MCRKYSQFEGDDDGEDIAHLLRDESISPRRGMLDHSRSRASNTVTCRIGIISPDVGTARGLGGQKLSSSEFTVDDSRVAVAGDASSGSFWQNWVLLTPDDVIPR